MQQADGCMVVYQFQVLMVTFAIGLEVRLSVVGDVGDHVVNGHGDTRQLHQGIDDKEQHDITNGLENFAQFCSILDQGDGAQSTVNHLLDLRATWTH